MSPSKKNPSRPSKLKSGTRGPGDDVHKGVSPPRGNIPVKAAAQRARMENKSFKFTRLYGPGPGDDLRKGVSPPRDQAGVPLKVQRQHLRSQNSQYITRDELITLLEKKLGPLWLKDADHSLFIGDSEYYCPPIDEAAGIIRNASLSSANYQEEIFDCDDFAVSLKGHFTNCAFQNGRNRPFAYAFGIIWLEKPFSHALNWIVAWPHRQREATTIYLVEPQTGSIYDIDAVGQLRPIDPGSGVIGQLAGEPYRDIYFITI